MAVIKEREMEIGSRPSGSSRSPEKAATSALFTQSSKAPSSTQTATLRLFLILLGLGLVLLFVLMFMQGR